MELEFNITKSFDEDIKEFPSEQQTKIKDKINFVSGSLLNGRTGFMKEASIPYIFNLKGGLHSSLYLVRLDDDKRMVVAVDDDPIFDKVSVTLFRLVNSSNAELVYKEVGENLYKSLGIL